MLQANRLEQLVSQHFPRATLHQKDMAERMYNRGLVLYEYRHQQFFQGMKYKAAQREFAEEMTVLYLKAAKQRHEERGRK